MQSNLLHIYILLTVVVLKVLLKFAHVSATIVLTSPFCLLLLPFFSLYHFPSCQDDILPGTRSISALKRLVKSNCQAALFDGAVSPAHLSLKVKDCCQSQIRELRGADLHDMSLSPGAGRLTCPIQACLKTYAVCLVSNATNRTYICGLRGS